MRILYCRIGWSTAYRGDEKPIGGGKYNEDHIGHEIHNYLGFNGKYYGYVEPGQHSSIHIEKIFEDKSDKNINTVDSISNVLVVWVSRNPEGGQYVIGWYKDATVYRRMQTVPAEVMLKRQLKDHNDYNIYSENVTLLPSEERTFIIKAKGQRTGIGQSNVWYGNEETNNRVIEYINKYSKLNRDRISDVEYDINHLEGREREAVLKVRINQDKFRDGLIRKYKGKCCLCGVSHTALLIASHIKPWSKSDNFEKLDINNGLLLCPNHDRLLDSGLVTFDEDGRILISDKLNDTNRIFMNVRGDMKINITDENRDYMRYHRVSIFIKNGDEANDI